MTKAGRGGAARPAGDRRQAILAAAAAVFARKGYGGTRIEDVAREAKLSYGLAYYYFSSKDRLFHRVLCGALDRTMTRYLAAQRLPGSARARIGFLVQSLLSERFSKEGMPDTQVMVQAFTHTGIPRATRAMMDARMLEFEAVLVQMIRGAQAEGRAGGKDPLVLATMLSALLAGLAVMRYAYPDSPLPDADTFLFFPA